MQWSLAFALLFTTLYSSYISFSTVPCMFNKQMDQESYVNNSCISERNLQHHQT
jgi:hypothetical protein